MEDDIDWDEIFMVELLHAEEVAVANLNPSTASVHHKPVDAPAPIAVSYPPASRALRDAASCSSSDPAFPVAASHLSNTYAPHIAASNSPAPAISRIPDGPHASASSSARFSPPRQRWSHAAVAGGGGGQILATRPSAPVVAGFSPPRELSQRPGGRESDCEAADHGHSPPRELSQHPRLVAGGSDREIVVAVDRSRGAVRRERDARDREVERLKNDLKRVTKQKNDLESKCNELAKERMKKDFEFRAKETEIENLKKAKEGYAGVDICSTEMDIDQSFRIPANGALHPGGSCWTSTTRADKSNGKNKELHSSEDVLCFNERNQTNESGVLKQKHLARIDKSKEIKTIGIQTDLPCNSEQLDRKKILLDSISSDLSAIWGRSANSLFGRNLVSKIVASCTKEILMLFQSTRLSDKCEASSELSSSINDAISEVYDIIIKMNRDAIPMQTLLEALLNLCSVGDAVVVSRALRILHSILQNMLVYGTNSNQRNNVSYKPYVNNVNVTGRNNDEGSSTSLNPADAEKILNNNDGLDNGSITHAFWTSFFTAMLQIGVKYSEENIRVDALSIMILIVRSSDPKGERENFEFTSVMESLHQLLQKENGLLVKKHSVDLLFLLLNRPMMLKLLCSGGKGGPGQMEAAGCDNDKQQEAIGSVLNDLSECLTCAATSSLELKLCRLVVILLAYIASSGKSGYEVLLGSVTARGANFLELITEVLASQMDCEVDFSTEAQELLKERYLLTREALILLNRLASHSNFSKPTLEVLTSSKLCATLTVDVAVRLPQRSKYPLRHLSEINPQMANELAELAQKFRSRVYGFMEERHSTAASSNRSASEKGLHRLSKVSK